MKNLYKKKCVFDPSYNGFNNHNGYIHGTLLEFGLEYDNYTKKISAESLDSSNHIENGDYVIPHIERNNSKGELHLSWIKAKTLKEEFLYVAKVFDLLAKKEETLSTEDYIKLNECMKILASKIGDKIDEENRKNQYDNFVGIAIANDPTLISCS